MRVFCATCNMKPVDKFSWWIDNEDKTMHLKAECHGAVDNSEIDLQRLNLRESKALEHADGVAFMPPIKLVEKQT